MSGIQNIRDGLTGNITKLIVIAIIITFIGSVGWAGFFSQGNINVVAKVGSKEITNTDLSVDDSSSDIVASFPSATIGDLVQGLREAGVTSRDLISVLQAMRAAGAVHAEIIVQ